MFTVLGAGGFIGGALAASLRKNGAEVFAPTRGDASVFSRPLGHVIYSIGLTADFRQRPYDTAHAHVSFLTDILERTNYDSITYLSSTRVYAGGTDCSPGARLGVNPADPSDLYNVTKIAGESLCLNAAEGKGRVVRLSNVVGVAATASENFIDGIVAEALAGRIVMGSAPESSKDYVNLSDVVELLPKIAGTGERAIYNLASGKNLRNDTWTDRLRELTGCEVSYAVGCPVWSFPEIDITDTVREFGFSPGSALDILPALISRTSRPS